MRFRRQRPGGLPDGHHFALTWEIPDNFGGLTKAMLQRSCAFSESAGTPVSILTFALQTNLDEVRADLKARGLLTEGVTLHNLWEDLRVLSDDVLRTAQFDPQFAEPREAESGEELVPILRTDGTLVATQLWTRAGPSSPIREFGDYVVETALWSRGGALIGGWRGSWGLWKFWTDLQMAEPDSYAIVDDSVIADFMAHHNPGEATRLYLFHNNHLARRREPPYAPLDRWRRYVCEHHADFDAIVFLTETQRLDFGKLLPGVDNSHTIPNIVTGGTPPTRVLRVPGRAVILARFSPQKRLDHAFRAIADAAGSHPELHLDLYGSGPRETELRELAAELGGPITFHSYTESPAAEFARSSFSLLTSTHEGLGLSVIESMAAGCVPLAYDVPYGPSDIITHGVDGFLVPGGNHRGMARQIDEFLTLDPRKVRKMRDAGRKRAEAFAAKPIIGMWGDAMRAARQHRTAPRIPVSFETLSAQEKLAAITRCAPTMVHAELIDSIWLDDTHLRMTVRVHLSGEDDAANSPERELLAKVIRRPTGKGQPVPLSFPEGLDQPEDPPGSRYVALDIEVNNLSEELDHVVLLSLSRAGDPAWDAIRACRDARDWLAFPSASANRPILIFSKKRGVELVTAAPKVAAEATATGNDVTLKAEALVGTSIESLQAKGLKGTSSIDAEHVSPGVFRLRLPESGLWEVRATIDGTSRLVAWGPSSDELNAVDSSHAPVRVGASPRGYLRLTATAATAAEPSP